MLSCTFDGVGRCLRVTLHIATLWGSFECLNPKGSISLQCHAAMPVSIT